jgi:hypothetical protein
MDRNQHCLSITILWGDGLNTATFIQTVLQEDPTIHNLRRIFQETPAHIPAKNLTENYPYIDYVHGWITPGESRDIITGIALAIGRLHYTDELGLIELKNFKSKLYQDIREWTLPGVTYVAIFIPTKRYEFYNQQCYLDWSAINFLNPLDETDTIADIEHKGILVLAHRTMNSYININREDHDNFKFISDELQQKIITHNIPINKFTRQLDTLTWYNFKRSLHANSRLLELRICTGNGFDMRKECVCVSDSTRLVHITKLLFSNFPNYYRDPDYKVWELKAWIIPPSLLNADLAILILALSATGKTGLIDWGSIWEQYRLTMGHKMLMTSNDYGLLIWFPIRPEIVFQHEDYAVIRQTMIGTQSLGEWEDQVRQLMMRKTLEWLPPDHPLTHDIEPTTTISQEIEELPVELDIQSIKVCRSILIH